MILVIKETKKTVPNPYFSMGVSNLESPFMETIEIDIEAYVDRAAFNKWAVKDQPDPKLYKFFEGKEIFLTKEVVYKVT